MYIIYIHNISNHLMLSQNELKEILSTSLAELGLNDQEINLYVVSLKLGPSSIMKLSEVIHVSRPNVYKLIARLELFGLARFSTRRKNSKVFTVESPAVIADLLRHKDEEINRQSRLLTQSMPDLLGLYQQGDLPASLKVFEGISACREAFFRIFDETKDKLFYFGSVKDLFDFVNVDPEESWMKKRIEKKVFIDVLVLPSDEANKLRLKDATQLRETRIIKNASPFTSSFYIYGKKLIFWQPKAPIAILIEDENITSMMMSIFLMLWNQTKVNINKDV